MKYEQEYQWRLLERARCRLCAEKVERAAIIGGEDCPHCGALLNTDPKGFQKRLHQRKERWRLKGYGLMALASGGAGLIPLVQALVQVGAMVILHLWVLRRGMRWLSVKRRMLMRIKLRLMAATIAVVALVLNIAVAPLLGLSGVILAVSGPLLTALYVESGVAMLNRGLRRDEEGRKLGWMEWMVPLMGVMALVVSIGLLVMAVGSGLYWLSQLEWVWMQGAMDWALEVLE